ncbi:flagellar hook assembly protein [Lacticigenium naphthae]|uniref:flagellar hook assembly protein n=1 Tax=Lacticigenium naphthae TaxID=515351 RepID=UPI000407FFA5|nr:flagellar hook assembly protein [Lacticigenium naphthae]
MEMNNASLMGMRSQVNGVEKTPEVKNPGTLSTDDFMKIMAAAISLPSLPGDDGGSGGGGGEMDYISQMAQMNTLDQMTQLTEAMNMTLIMSQQQQAIQMVGKNVTVMGEEAGLVTGVVEKVKFNDGLATILIGGKEYGMNAITEMGGSE